MTSMIFSLRPWTLPALCLLIFSTGCATDNARRLAQAHADQARADVVTDVISDAEAERERARELPAMPEDCRRWEVSGVTESERLDAALLRTDAALGRANARVRRCYDWYDSYRRGIAGAE